MADDDYLARDKADKGRFTLTPEERKLRRQTAEADRKIRREIPAVDPDVPQEEGPALPGPSRNPLEKDQPETASYARGGMVKHGSPSRAPACKGGKVISSRSY